MPAMYLVSLQVERQGCYTAASTHMAATSIAYGLVGASMVWAVFTTNKLSLLNLS